MRSPARVVAGLYVRHLLPSRLASGAFWRLALRDDRIKTEVITGKVRLGRGSITLRLPLRHMGNWELLFNATARTDHAATLPQFDRLIQSAGCVLDVGANVGIYTYWAALNAPIGCEIVAVEANPDLAANLRHNLGAHGAATAEVVTAALTDEPGDVTLYLGHLDSVSSISQRHVEAHGGGPGSLVVTGTTIDALTHQRGLRPDVIKIDVEGHELAVLRGGQRTLRESRPAVLVEVVRANAPAVHAMLTDLGYTGRRFDSRGLLPIDADIVPESARYGDFLYERA